jgi:hypothetical protein
MRLILAVDFDDTIATNDRWPEIGAPKEGVREALTQLIEKFEIIIYTCRTNLSSRHRDYSIKSIKEYMATHRIPYDRLDLGLEGKVYADFYVDDKGVAFEDNWPELAEALTEGLS